MRDLVRFVLKELESEAKRTSAFGRGKVLTDNEDGSYQVIYKGRELKLEGVGRRLSVGQTIDVCRSDGQHSVSGLSAYA